MTKRRMLEIEEYYEIDELTDLEIWKREYNIPPREMAPAILNQASTFNAKAETLTDSWETPPNCRTLEPSGALG